MNNNELFLEILRNIEVFYNCKNIGTGVVNPITEYYNNIDIDDLYHCNITESFTNLKIIIKQNNCTSVGGYNTIGSIKFGYVDLNKNNYIGSYIWDLQFNSKKYTVYNCETSLLLPCTEEEHFMYSLKNNSLSFDEYNEIHTLKNKAQSTLQKDDNNDNYDNSELLKVRSIDIRLSSTHQNEMSVDDLHSIIQKLKSLQNE